jgi:hypothetical protein
VNAAAYKKDGNLLPHDFLNGFYGLGDVDGIIRT